MDSVNYARATSQPTIITIQLTQSSLMHGIGYVLLYKALAAGDNYYITPFALNVLTPLSASLHSQSINRTTIILTFGENEVDNLLSKSPSNTEVPLIQTSLKFFILINR